MRYLLLFTFFCFPTLTLAHHELAGDSINLLVLTIFLFYLSYKLGVK